MGEIFEEEKNNKLRKKKKKDLSKSEVFGSSITNRLSSDIDVSDYLDDFLQHSKGAVFITGNENVNSNQQIKPMKRKKILKKIVKKKKTRRERKN